MRNVNTSEPLTKLGTSLGFILTMRNVNLQVNKKYKNTCIVLY